MGPIACVYLNAFAGLVYCFSLVGFDPALPDPTYKYWQQKETAATRAILQFFALALLWINLFMLYALRYLGAPATGLLRFQSIGWLSILSLMAFQVNRYGFVAQQETLGIQLSLFFVSAYLGYAP